MKSQSHLYVDAMKQDIEAERLVQGNSSNCWIGCVLREYDHKKMAQTLDWPLTLVRISEQIFEGMAKEDAQIFAVDVLAAPKPNANLSLAPWIFLHQMVAQTLDRHADEKTKKACEAVVDVLLRKSRGEYVSQEEVREARSADADADADAYAADAYAYAYAAADAAADAAAYAYAADADADADAYAADAYAYAAADAAADAAAYAYAADAARRNRHKELGDMLLTIIKEAA